MACYCDDRSTLLVMNPAVANLILQGLMVIGIITLIALGKLHVEAGLLFLGGLLQRSPVDLVKSMVAREPESK